MKNAEKRHLNYLDLKYTQFPTQICADHPFLTFGS